MANDIVPTEGTSWADVLEKFNIPKLVAGAAGDALSRLIGRVVDIPVAKLEQITQSIKDKTQAKSLVTQTLSKEVAKNIGNDKDLIQRAADSFLAKELRKQTNKEAVAQKTIELLAKTEPPHAQNDAPPNPTAAEESARHLDEDWLNIFEQYAENASSERLQDLWSKTLAGEIRAPKSFSLATLRFIAELDQETAALFEKHSGAIINGDFIPFLTKYRTAPHFADFLALEESGLLSGSSGTLHKTFTFHRAAIFMQRGSVIIGMGKEQMVMQIPALLLTKIGREIATLSNVNGSIERAKEFVAEMPKSDLDHIVFQTIPQEGNAETPVVSLWRKEVDAAVKS